MIIKEQEETKVSIAFNTDLDGSNYVDGRFVVPANTSSYTKVNPANGRELGKFPQTSARDVALAVHCARKAFTSWKKLSRVNRAEYFNTIAQVIDERRDELATAISLDTGKNYNESIAEVNEALHMAQYAFGSGRTPQGEAIASELAEKDSYMLRKPKGVIAIVSPFNFPLAIGGFWCAAPALVEGNTVVLKPSEDAPLTAHLTAKIYDEAGLPPGVFNIVHGDGNTGDHLIRDNVDHVCFTGSAAVGQHVRQVCAGSWHKTSSCEMGSKSAVIVFDDCNYDLALSASLASAFKLSGQRCVSASRLIVHRSIYDRFAKDFAALAAQLKTGAPFKDVDADEMEVNEDMYYGPIINELGYAKVRRYNDMVLKDSKTEVLLPPVYTGQNGSHYSTPLVYKTEWRDNAPYLREEVFGPHVAIVPFDTTEEAIHIYNDTEFGLAVGIVTENYKTARIMRDECDAGMIYWNGGSIAAESHLAFGGVKKSGNGYPSAARTCRAVTHEVSWTVNHGDELAFPQGMTK
jgi:aldehyde dehydrogenase (NAD+)